MLAALLPLGAYAEQEKQADLTWSPSVSIYSEYLLANGYIADHRAVWNVSNTISYNPWGLSFTYWESFGSHPGFGNEKDYTIQKAFKAWDLDVLAGVAYFALHNDNDMIQPYLDVSKTLTYGKLSISPAVRLEFPQVTPRTKFEGGNYVHARVNASYKLTERLSVSALAEALYDDGVGGFTSGIEGKVAGEMSYSFGSHVSAFAGATWMTPVTGIHDSRHSVIVPGVGIRGHFEF